MACKRLKKKRSFRLDMCLNLSEFYSEFCTMNPQPGTNFPVYVVEYLLLSQMKRTCSFASLCLFELSLCLSELKVQIMQSNKQNHFSQTRILKKTYFLWFLVGLFFFQDAQPNVLSLLSNRVMTCPKHQRRENKENKSKQTT